MREKLNENPLAQVALVAILVVVGAYMFISSSGGGEEESAPPTEATVAVAGPSAVGTATGATPGEAVEGAVESAVESVGEAAPTSAPTSVPAPPPPAPVTAAYDSGQTVVLLIVHDGGDYLNWDARSWRISDTGDYQGPDLRETGYWRFEPEPEDPSE